MSEKDLPYGFLSDIKGIDYTSPVTKLNIAVDKLPSFKCAPHSGNTPGPHHFTTIHMNCESIAEIDR